MDVPISSPGSLISENKFAPLEADDVQHISDLSSDVQRLFHEVSTTERGREEGLQIIAVEDTNELPFSNEELIEIESVTELEPAASIQNPFLLSKEVIAALLEYDLCIRAVTRKGKQHRKGGASLNNNNKKLTREVKALLGSWEREAQAEKDNNKPDCEGDPC